MSNPWGAATNTQETQGSFLEENVAAEKVQSFDILDPFKESYIPLDTYVNTALEWTVLHFRDFFQLMKMPIEVTLTNMESFLQSLSPWAVILAFTLFAIQFSSKRISLMVFVSFIFIGLIGAWAEAMITLSLVLTSVLFSVLIGLPLGIITAKSDMTDKLLRPLLDAMQTTPAFVYLIPIVMLFGIGNVPGVIVTIIFALPPLIRLTNLGIRQVPSDLIEASRSFGANNWQLLFKVQLRVAMPTIMAGINQTLMLALSMVVIASMIAVGGLGQMVLRGIGRLDIGLAAIGGIGIVLLAIILDRLTQEMGKQTKNKHQKWYTRSLAGVFYNFIKRIQK